MMLNNKFIVLILGLSVLTSSWTLAETNNEKWALKDPGVINKERILYWLTKRGELKETATEAEKQLALKEYLKGANKGSFKEPAKLFKARAQQQYLLKQQKPDVRLQKVQTKNTFNKTVNILVVLVDFPDLPYDDNRLTRNDTSMYYDDYNPDHYNGLIFSPTGYPGPSGQNLTSAYQYYEQVSGSSLALQGDIFGWVTADEPAATYGANDPDDNDNDIDVESLVIEAVEKAVAAGNLNLADFDVENQYGFAGSNPNIPDGFIDHIMIFHSSIGEEAGGGVLGDDAIWSHRGFIKVNFDISPSDWGHTISGTDYKILGYTVEPLDSAAGVVVHEFAHDLGVADEYNTNSSEIGDASTVGYWSVMASGSWSGLIPGTQPTGFSPVASSFFQEYYGGNWIDPKVFNLEDLITNPETITLSEAVNHDALTNMLKVKIPEPLIEFFPPFTGTYQYYSGSGDMKNNSMSFPLDVPAATSLELRMKAHWNIELDWDYARILVNGTAIAGNHTRVDNPIKIGITNYLSDISANIPDATGAEGWVDLIFDMSEFAGQTVEISIEYVTDESVGDYGLVIDDIQLVADGSVAYFDGAEEATGPTLSGFTRITNSRPGAEQNYWVQMRSFNGVDTGLAAEGYQRGMLVWFEDKNYTDNHVDLHPGHGFISVVDAGQEIVNNSGGFASATTQVRDATFSFYDAATYSAFDDSLDFTTPEQPSSGVILPVHGLNISLQTQETDSSSASLFLSVGEVTWVAAFEASKSFRTVTFVNKSSGTGNATASWDFGDGSPLSSEWEPTHTYQSSGDFNVTLTVTTVSDGTTDVVTQTVSLAELLTTSFEMTQNDTDVSLSATATGGEPAYSYEWDFGDGSTGTGMQTSHSYTESGSYTIELTVRSQDNQVATASQLIEIYVLPQASFTVSTNNLTARFTDSSTGGDGTFSYAWDFGDGSTSTEASPVHTYSSAGSYQVELTITDGQGSTSSYSQTVTVSSPPPPRSSSGGGGSAAEFILLGLLLLSRRKKKL